MRPVVARRDGDHTSGVGGELVRSHFVIHGSVMGATLPTDAPVDNNRLSRGCRNVIGVCQSVYHGGGRVRTISTFDDDDIRIGSHAGKAAAERTAVPCRRSRNVSPVAVRVPFTNDAGRGRSQLCVDLGVGVLDAVGKPGGMRFSADGGEGLIPERQDP